MENVAFDFSLKISSVQNDRNSTDVAILNLRRLQGICDGKMFVFFEPQREYIVLETGIIDYLLRLKYVIQEIDGGNCRPFAISADYYSNNLQFTYFPDNRNLEIYEVNGAEFRITTSYEAFKTAFEKFFLQARGDLLDFYPELTRNQAFHDAFQAI